MAMFNSYVTNYQRLMFMGFTIKKSSRSMGIYRIDLGVISWDSPSKIVKEVVGIEWGFEESEYNV